MTEAEWLTCDDPMLMLDFLRAKASHRKLRLFACGCVHQHADLVTEHHHVRILTVAERLADGSATLSELTQARQELFASDYALWAATQEDGWSAATAGSRDITMHVGQGAYPRLSPEATLEDKLAAVYTAEREECCRQVSLLREIVGNPFRPVTFDPSWRTSDVVALARGIYEERAFDRMPILVDALQDAGCENADILNHLRDPGAAHVRGCWALDLVLGKK